MLLPTNPKACPLHPRRGRGGFSLVEVMVAVAILGMLGGTVFMAMCRLHRNAADNRNYASAQIILRNAVDQALTRGWDDSESPNGIIAPTVPGNTAPYDAGASYWNRWNPFSESDSWPSPTTVPVYSDQMDVSRNVSGRLYRKVQFVTGTDYLLWVTMRLDYTYDGKAHSQQMVTLRAAD